MMSVYKMSKAEEKRALEGLPRVRKEGATMETFLNALYEAGRMKAPMPIAGHVDAPTLGKAIKAATAIGQYGYYTQIVRQGGDYQVRYQRHGF